MSTVRVPGGLPTGGQFAASTRSEAGLALAPGTPTDPATQARYQVAEDALEALGRDVCDSLEEEFGDEEAPDTTTLRDYLDDGWDAFDDADGTPVAMRVLADHVERAERHVWNTANSAPGGGHDEDGRRAAAREDYWDAKARASIASLKQVAATLREHAAS